VTCSADVAAAEYPVMTASPNQTDQLRRVELQCMRLILS
jgi:hypothetical protein